MAFARVSRSHSHNPRVGLQLQPRWVVYRDVQPARAAACSGSLVTQTGRGLRVPVIWIPLSVAPTDEDQLLVLEVP